MKIFYTIYKTVNTINGKFYIGKHQTKNPNDNYFGSGKAIKAAIKKYGKENFIKEILFIFNSEEKMNQKECEILTKDFISSSLNYNCGVGGEGGPQFKNKKHTNKSKEAISKKMKGRSLTTEMKNRMSANQMGRKLSNATKKILSEKAKNRYLNEEERKKISDGLKKYWMNKKMNIYNL